MSLPLVVVRFSSYENQIREDSRFSYQHVRWDPSQVLEELADTR